MTLLVGHLTHKIVSEMTYSVSNGTLNTTIPYHSDYVGGLGECPVCQSGFLSLLVCLFLYHTLWSNGASDLDQRGLKMRRSMQGCAFVGVNGVPLILGMRIGLSSQNDKNSYPYHLKITEPIMTKFLHGYHHNGTLWVVSRLPLTNPRWRTAAILKFVKC